LLAHGRWFSSGTPASSTTKTGGHDIAEILLKVALNTKKSNQINQARKVSGHVDTCMCVSGIEFVLFVLFSIGFWNCSDYGLFWFFILLYLHVYKSITNFVILFTVMLLGVQDAHACTKWN
jgi:hypothetical protein